MNQCKTQADLHRKMAEVYDFCKGTVFEGKEYMCVKFDGIPYLLARPCFERYSPRRFEFALGIVEDKPVWEGDKLTYYSKREQTLIKHPITEPAKWSWNPPAPPKPKTVSVSVNGGEAIELVLPDGVFGTAGARHIAVGNKVFAYTEEKDALAVVTYMQDLLEGKL